MADPPPSLDPKGEAGAGPGRGPPPSTPRWVKISGIIAIVLVLVFVMLHLTGRGFSRHTMPSGSTEHAGLQSSP